MLYIHYSTVNENWLNSLFYSTIIKVLFYSTIIKVCSFILPNITINIHYNKTVLK